MILQKKSTKSTTWRCNIRNRTHWCKATVLQKGEEFIRGVMTHEHAADPGITKKTKVKAKVTSEARVHAYKSAGNIVEDAFSEMIKATDFNLPKQTNLERMANRVRQSLRPAEPTDLSFVIDTEFLGCDDFLIGDIRVGEERHIMFATEAQLHVMQRAKRWYLAGTFKMIRDPFVQLFSIHAFVQKQDCMKQVPLAFVMMSKRLKIDYVAVFGKLNEVNIGEGVAVQGFVMDFEAAAWKALKEVYPDCDIRGCVFHWGQESEFLREVGYMYAPKD